MSKTIANSKVTDLYIDEYPDSYLVSIDVDIEYELPIPSGIVGIHTLTVCENVKTGSVVASRSGGEGHSTFWCPSYDYVFKNSEEAKTADSLELIFSSDSLVDDLLDDLKVKTYTRILLPNQVKTVSKQSISAKDEITFKDVGDSVLEPGIVLHGICLHPVEVNKREYYEYEGILEIENLTDNFIPALQVSMDVNASDEEAKRLVNHHANFVKVPPNEKRFQYTKFYFYAHKEQIDGAEIGFSMTLFDDAALVTSEVPLLGIPRERG